MSQHNIEVVQRLNAALNRGDLDAAFALYEPTAIWHSRSDEPDTGDYHGAQAIRAMAEMWRGMFDGLETEIGDYVDARDRVVVSGWLLGRGRESGATVREAYAWVLRMHEGRVAEVWEYRDRGEALQAVGLSDQPG